VSIWKKSGLILPLRTAPPTAQDDSHRKPGIEAREFITLTLLLFLILIYPVFSMLWYHQYPAVSIEAAILVILCLSIAALLSLILQFAGASVRNLALVTVLTFAFVVQFNLFFIGIISVLAAGLFLTLIFRDAFRTMLLAVMVCLIAGAWMDHQINPATKIQEAEPSAAQAGQGPVIHLLMDGFTGPDGLPAMNEAQELKQDIISLFRKNGFQIFTRAYTHYSSTMDSMTRAFNFRNDDENIWQRTSLLGEKISFPENKWFGMLADSGYNVVVNQTGSADFCSAAISTKMFCNVFSTPNLKTIHTDVKNPLTRVAVLLRTLIGQSILVSKVRRNYGVFDTWGVSMYDDRILEKLVEDLQQQPQNAYFAHVLLPHAPLVLRQDCTLDYESETWHRWPAFEGLVGNNEETRKVRYNKLIEQMRCALTRLDTFFGELRSLGIYDDATIIVHGDHGAGAFNFSPSVQNMDKTNDRDLREMFSILFAVKYPGGGSEVNDEVISLNVLMANTAARVIGSVLVESSNIVQSEDEPFIYFADSYPLKQAFVNIFHRKSDFIGEEQEEAVESASPDQ